MNIINYPKPKIINNIIYIPADPAPNIYDTPNNKTIIDKEKLNKIFINKENKNEIN